MKVFEAQRSGAHSVPTIQLKAGRVLKHLPVNEKRTPDLLLAKVITRILLSNHKFIIMFEKDLIFIQSILPQRYKCEQREQGVHCYDTTSKGINDDHKASDKYDPKYDNQWALICKAIKQKFGKRLMEIYSQEPQYHSKFTVYLRPE